MGGDVPPVMSCEPIMKNSYRFPAILALALAASAVMRAQAPQEKPKTPLPNYVELSPHIGTGGQPDETGLKQLAEKGYQAIINLRTSGEGVDLAAEEKLAMQYGLRYFMVPFNPREPSEAQALAFNALMSALKEDKVFVHCTAGVRVGSFMMIYLVLEQGMPREQAEQEARKVGLRTPALLDFANQVIDRHKK